MSQTAAMAWLQQQQRSMIKSHKLIEQSQLSPLFTNISNQISPFSPMETSPSPTNKISFSIDNIITGKYEEIRRGQSTAHLFSPISHQLSPVNHPMSPVSSVSSDNSGLKYECESCGKTYATFSGFTKHKQYYCTPQSKKQFNCKHCDKTYFSLGALKMHIRTHTLPCKCKVCGKAFSRPWLLQGHMRTHTGEKPFKCQHCGRAFADRSNLRAHLQTHSDVKKYCCKQCHKTFSRMSLLVKHEESACTSSLNDSLSSSQFSTC